MNKITMYLAIVAINFLYVNCSSLPLLDAVEEKNLANVKKVIEKGGDPNEGDCLGALTVAAWNGDADIVEYLLSKGANPNQRGRECEFRAPYIGKYKMGNRTPIQGTKDVKTAKLLLEKGADVNLGGYREYTGGDVSLNKALSQAIYIGNFELVELYLKQKIDFKVYELNGKNEFISDLEKLASKDASAASKISAILKSKLSNLPMTDANLKATDGKILKSYTHIPSGAKTMMSDDIAQKLYDNPRNFAPLTLNAADNRYYHHSEFVWDNGQNMYEWYILRNAKVNPKKEAAKK